MVVSRNGSTSHEHGWTDEETPAWWANQKARDRAIEFCADPIAAAIPVAFLEIPPGHAAQEPAVIQPYISYGF
jgi:hypothetical protein